MPTYTFHNKTTGVVEDVFLKMSEKEQYLKDNAFDIMFQMYKNKYIVES